MRRHSKNSVDVVPTKEGYDLMINGIEVGSYGLRMGNGYEWVYGTGLAEPRFSVAINTGIK